MTQVLIIDDDRGICKILSGLIYQMGYVSVCKHTLEAGLTEALSNPYGVVLLDVNLPDGIGLDIIPQLRRTPSSPEVIIMTGFGDEDGAETAIRSGAWDYILKTDSPQKIVLPLQRVFQYRDELKKSQILPVALKMDGIVGRSAQMKACLDLLAQAAGSDVNVLLTGETGTGKELFAQAIHNNSTRFKHSFVVVDCAALPEKLVESALFGHKKGAFTGAENDHEGMILQAHGGTLFLDEIGELPLSVQKVFLRVLQEHRFRPVGSRHEVKSDFRLVAATNRNLDQQVQEGRFRRDLLYRLRALTIHLPPLRERLKDIAEIIIYQLAGICERHHDEMKGFSPEFIEILSSYHWPGNVRELIKALEVAVIAAGSGRILFPKHLPEHIRVRAAKTAVRKNLPSKSADVKTAGDVTPMTTLKEYRRSVAARAEKEYLQDLAVRTRGNIKAASRISGLSPSRLYELIKKHQIPI